jgi:hypothetical protein
VKVAAPGARYAPAPTKSDGEARTDVPRGGLPQLRPVVRADVRRKSRTQLAHCRFRGPLGHPAKAASSPDVMMRTWITREASNKLIDDSDPAVLDRVADKQRGVDVDVPSLGRSTKQPATHQVAKDFRRM